MAQKFIFNQLYSIVIATFWVSLYGGVGKSRDHIMRRSVLIGVTLAAALLANASFAGSYVSCSEKSHRNMDFSDSGTNSNNLSYSSACHDTDQWQGLGDSWISKRLGDSTYTEGSTPDSWDTEDVSNPNAPAANHDNNTDDGVLWRTSTDPSNWTSNFGTTATLTQGEYVQFQFLFSRSVDGNHLFDELKVWLDWNQDGHWDNTAQNDEIITNVRWDKDDNVDGSSVGNRSQSYCYDNGLTWNNDTDTCNSDDDFKLFTAQVQVPLDAQLGDTWLRARVTCENSLSFYDNNWIMSPYGYLHQGEVEDYMVTIAEKKEEPPVNVSEPSSLLIMSPALLFLAGIRRKRKQ